MDDDVRQGLATLDAKIDAGFDRMADALTRLADVVQAGFAQQHQDIADLRTDLNAVMGTVRDHIEHHPPASS